MSVFVVLLVVITHLDHSSNTWCYLIEANCVNAIRVHIQMCTIQGCNRFPTMNVVDTWEYQLKGLHFLSSGWFQPSDWLNLTMCLHLARWRGTGPYQPVEPCHKALQLHNAWLVTKMDVQLFVVLVAFFLARSESQRSRDLVAVRLQSRKRTRAMRTALTWRQMEISAVALAMTLPLWNRTVLFNQACMALSTMPCEHCSAQCSLAFILTIWSLLTVPARFEMPVYIGS